MGSRVAHAARLAGLHGGGAHHCMIEAREKGSRNTAVRFACLLGSLAAFRRLYTCSMSCAPASAAKQAHAQALAQYSAQLQGSYSGPPSTSTLTTGWELVQSFLLRGLSRGFVYSNRLCHWLQPSLAQSCTFPLTAEVGMPAVLCSPFTGSATLCNASSSANSAISCSPLLMWRRALSGDGRGSHAAQGSQLTGSRLRALHMGHAALYDYRLSLSSRELLHWMHEACLHHPIPSCSHHSAP